MSSYKRKTKLISKDEERRNNKDAKVELIKEGQTNATSSKMEGNFHDLPYSGVAAAARRFLFGASRHGRFNWQQGDKDFAEARLNHLVEHTLHFAEFRTQADLDAIICNAMMVAWFYDRGRLSKDPYNDFMLQGKNVQNK